MKWIGELFSSLFGRSCRSHYSFSVWPFWLCFLLFFCLGFSLIVPTIQAAEPVDLPRLRDVICHQIESSAEGPHPEWTKGDGKKGNPQSWGLCQIQYNTAVGIGGLGWLERAAGFPAVFIALGNADKAKDVALTILRWCAAVKGRRTVIGLAACYNSQAAAYPMTGSGPLRDYAERVAEAYNGKEDK